MQKYKIITGMIVLSAALIFTGINPALAADNKQLGAGIAAEVNGIPIYAADVDKRLDFLMNQIAAQIDERPSEADLAAIRNQILKDLIEYKLLINESQKQGVVVSEAEFQQELAEIKSNFVNEAGFTAALEQASLTEAEFNQTIKDTLIIDKLLDQQLADKIKVSDAEALAYYNQNAQIFEQEERVHARHILKMVEPNASAIDKDKKKKELEEVLRALNNGSDFSELATKYSDDPSRLMGGDLGYFTRGRMVKPFEEAAFALKPGEISGIVETQFGYHIIKVEDHQSARKIPFDEIKSFIVDNLAEERKGQLARDYINDLYSQATIVRQGE